MKEKNNNKTYAFIVLGVIGTIILTLGITYAYWRLTKEQTGENVVNTDCFNIEFTGENDITLDKSYPLEDDELESFLGSATPYHFTITNKCSSLASATINLESLNASPDKQLDDEWVDAILYETDYHKKLNKSFKLTGNPNNDANKVIKDAIHAYSLKNFTLKANEVKDYYLLLYMDQETPLREDTQNAHWKGKITLSAEYKFDQFANSGTLRGVSSSDTNGMWNYKDKLTKIVIETKKSKKEGIDGQNVYGPFNESVYPNYDAIQSYVVCEAEDTSCIGYLQGDGGIKLNNSSSNLFKDFTNVTEIEGIENLDTSSVTTMNSMFRGMSNLQELDLSSFDTNRVTNTEYMFYDCSQLQTLILGDNFDTSNVTKMSSMFNGMSSLQKLDLSSFDTSSVENMDYMFNNMSSLTSLTFGNNFNASSVTSMYMMFDGCSQLQTLDLSSFNTSSVKTMTWMFGNMKNLRTLILGDNFDTSNVTKMGSMFNGMSSLQTLDLSSFNTSSVTGMASMFSGMSSLQKLDLSSFDTSSVTDMKQMFYNCSQLQTLTFGKNFDTSSVTDMSDMFGSCSQLQFLDLSNFNTSSVTNMNSMFSRDNNLVKITYGPNFIHKDEADTTNMFSGCPANRPDANVHSSWEGVTF